MNRLKVAGLGLALLAGCDSDPQLQALNDELQLIRQQAVPLADETPVARPGLRFVASAPPLRDPFQSLTSGLVAPPASPDLLRISTAPGSIWKGLPWISSRWSARCHLGRRHLPCCAVRQVFIAWRWGITWGQIMGAS